MELFARYLKKKLPVIVLFALFVLIFAGSLRLYRLPLQAAAYPLLLCTGIGLSVLPVSFFREKQKHAELMRIQSMIDARTGSFLRPAAISEEDYQHIIRLLCEEHHAFCLETQQKTEDMMDYYTVWAHQIKTPIASMRLHLQNEDSPLARSLQTDLNRIEQYAEMVLTFLRLDSKSTDYVFREYDLDTLVRAAVRKFSSEFISRRLSLVYEPLNRSVVTDEKWLTFVVEQVLSNALKYTSTGSIAISFIEEDTLQISDTGIGIAAEDLPRIFEKGYTGYNGRIDHRASGIGLYLCRQICTNLGHEITALSAPGKGTTIRIRFSKQI